jgi:replicative DNA helicase
MYRELVEHDIRKRGTIEPVGKIFPTPSDHLRYCSLFMFGTDILSHVKTNKSVAEFKGKVYCEAIWLDVDYDKDVNEARTSTIEVIKRLSVEYGVNPDDLFIYFSGKKGFHLAIFNTLIGFTHSTPIEPDKVKDFVRRLTNGIPHLDLKIYEPVRIFRIENSRHEKSGLYKIRISFTELQCDLEDILTLAKEPRQYPYKKPAGFTLNEKLNALWLNSGNYVQEQKQFESKGNLFQPPPEGSRNNTLLIQACTLFRKSELSSNAILDIVSNAAYLSNQGAKEAIDQAELKRIVFNAERLVGDERKKSKEQEDELQMRSFGEWIDTWESYVLQEKTDFSLCFNEINQTVQGRVRGKLGVLMGYGGTKKSLYALNIALKNMKIVEDVFIYSTMEMGVPQLIDRIIDYEVKCTYGNNAHETAAKILREDVNEGRGYIKGQLGEMLGNRLQIISNSRMTYEGYKKAVHKCKETIGQPVMLIVDGLSMMGGKGTETELYSQNSADLKQLANEENILVLLICHVSKGAEKWTRDLSRNIRGSEKILDNCDFYATLSQIQDAENPEMYRQDIGFINFVDKRGSGKSIDVVYSFDSKRLRLGESLHDPSIFYEPVKKARKSEIDF